MPQQQRPNVVLILVDQWRGDCLGVAGHPVVETPHLDELYLRGAHCSQAYAAVPSCIAARASIWTGMKPKTHGRVSYRDGVEWNYDTTLAGELTAAGYQTQAVGKMHFYPARSQMGFQNVILHDGYVGYERGKDTSLDLTDDYVPWLRDKYGRRADVTDTGMQANSWVVCPWVYDEMSHPTNWATTEAIDFLRRRDPRKPFFLNVSYVRPHAPLDPPQHYLDMYERKELPPLPMGDWTEQDTDQSGLQVNTSFGDIGAAQLDRARRAYYALMTHIDHQISRLMMALSDSGAGDTMVIFAGDHGEMMGDHRWFRKIVPYDGSVRVPFLVRWPGSMKIPGRQVIDRPVELRDIMPTILDVAGVEIPDTVEGRSLVPLARGDTDEWREYVHGEHHIMHYVTSGREKYIWWSRTGREQLFDIAADPQELHDLVDEKPDRVAHWRQRLIAELADRPEGFVKDGKLVAGVKLQAVLDSAGQGPQ